MDCKTARLLLDFARPNSNELDETESRILEEHLAGCADCEQQAAAERRADEVIGRAMRAVEVPDQLRSRILTRLKEEQIQHRRRWPAYSVRGALAAAALLLLALGLWRWSMVRPPFPADALAAQANNWVIAPPDRKQVQEAFKAQGVEMVAPADLNYGYARFLFLANVEGRPTPTLLFNKVASSGLSQHALVYIVSDSQFDADALPVNSQASNGYEYKCFIRPPQGDHFGYVAYYTGDDLSWLRARLVEPGGPAMTSIAAPPVSMQPMTASEFYDFVHRPENHYRYFELDRGEVVEMPPPTKYHGFVCGNVARILGNFAVQRRKGYVCTNDAGIIVEHDPDTVRGPDVTFYEDAQNADDMDRRYTDRPPVLAVEVMSPNDRINKTIRRITQMLRGGVAVVWLVDPESRDVSVYRLGQDPLLFVEEQELASDPVLADFRCRVADFFVIPGA